jgi:hypothetical protein
MQTWPLADRILQFATAKNNTRTSIWHRRCGIVPFVLHTNNNSNKTKAAKANQRCLPTDFTIQLIEACEQNIIRTPQERFTQTGIAWVLRYVLASTSTSKKLTHEDSTSTTTSPRQVALNMILRYPSIWTTEAKKSFVEKLNVNDPIRRTILSLK